MSKNTGVSNLQKYAIHWLKSEGWENDKIATEVDLTEKQVNNILKSSKTNDNAIKTKTEVMGSKTKNLMITETVNRQKNVAIMTKEASMVNDELKKNKTTTNNRDKSLKQNIFKINHNE